jgi:hypothetical protein
VSVPYLDWLQAQPEGQLINERRPGGSGRMLTEQRTVTRTRRTRNRAEFNAFVQELLECQPRTVSGYQARLAALEELVRQTDAL